MKRNLLKYSAILGVILAHNSAYAGNLFSVTSSGAGESISFILCLNANAALSCQTYTSSGSNLQILAVANHAYPNAGIKVTTNGFEAISGCAPLSNGFCAFPVSNTTPANIGISPPLYGVTGLSGAFENTLFKINPGTAFPAMVMPLTSNGDGSIIASNGATLYHFTYNAMESLDFTTNTTTNIPVSGTSFNEPYGAVWFNSSNAFLIQRRSSQTFMTVTTGGFRSVLASNSRKRGFACYNHNIYGVDQGGGSLSQINPANGAALSTVSLSLPGHTIDNALGLTVNPGTGVFYILLKIDGNDLRTLATVDINTGVCTIIGTIDDGSGLFISSITFHPADSSC